MKTMYFNYCFKKVADDNFIKVIQSQRMRWGGHIACGRAMKTAHSVLIGKPEKKRSSGRQVYYNEPSGCMVCTCFNSLRHVLQ
jgi:hypothetical protein